MNQGRGKKFYGIEVPYREENACDKAVFERAGRISTFISLPFFSFTSSSSCFATKYFPADTLPVR